MREPNTIIKKQWYYLPTALLNGREWAIFVREFRIEKTPGQNYLLKRHQTVLFLRRQKMIDWIEENKARVLPPKADGNLDYTPRAFRYKKLGNYLDPRLIKLTAPPTTNHKPVYRGKR